MPSFSDKGRDTCWKVFIKYPYILTGVRKDNNVDATANVLCLLYGIEENGVKDIAKARHSGLVTTERDLEMLPPTHYKLELHIKRQSNKL